MPIPGPSSSFSPAAVPFRRLASLALAACTLACSEGGSTGKKPAPRGPDDNVLLFAGDYESGVLEEERWRPRLEGGTATIVGEPVRSGKFACRFTLDPKQERAELQPEIKKHKIGTERWYGFSIFIPADWEVVGYNEIVAQWKHTNDEDKGETAGSPPLALRIDDTEWRINCRFDSRAVSDKENPEGKVEIARVPYERDRWTDWVFRYRTSYDDDGLIEAWKDGKLVARYEGPNCYNDEQGLYFKWGLSYAEAARMLYNDELRIGDERATYPDVAPPPLER